MATTTRTVARQEIGKMTMPRWRTRATTTAVATTQVIDLSLEGEGYHLDNSLNGKWVWLSTATNASVERIIEAYTGSTGAITVRGINLVTEAAAGTAFEIYDFAPTDIHNALNWAMNHEYKYIWNSAEDTTLTTHHNQTHYSVPAGIQDIDEIWLEKELNYDFDENILKDYGGFEDWAVSTKPDGTDAATGMTLTKAVESDDQPVKYGDYAVKAVVTASTAASHYFTTVTTPANFDSVKTTFSMWVYCTTASRVSIEIKDNTGSTASTLTHGGTGWERMEVTRNTCVSPTSLQAGITCTSGTSITIYYDNAIWTRTDKPVSNRWYKLHKWDVYEDGIRFGYALPEDMALRLVGRKPLTAYAAETGTTEIGEPQTQILYASALLYLYRQYRAQATGKLTNQYDDDIGYWTMELDNMRKKYRMARRYTTPMSLYRR